MMDMYSKISLSILVVTSFGYSQCIDSGPRTIVQKCNDHLYQIDDMIVRTKTIFKSTDKFHLKIQHTGRAKADLQNGFQRWVETWEECDK